MTGEGIFEPALEEARRGFDQLTEDMARVRDRASSLIAVGGIAASFLGGLSIRDGAELTPYTLGAVGAFAVMSILAC